MFFISPPLLGAGKSKISKIAALLKIYMPFIEINYLYNDVEAPSWGENMMVASTLSSQKKQIFSNDREQGKRSLGRELKYTVISMALG